MGCANFSFISHSNLDHPGGTDGVGLRLVAVGLEEQREGWTSSWPGARSAMGSLATRTRNFGG